MALRPWMHVAWIASLALAGTASEAALLPEVTAPGQLNLPYSHRFTAGDKLVSTPTFTLATGLAQGMEASLRLALDSDIRSTRPEWEPRLTYQFDSGAGPWRLAIATAYNTAALSADTALLGSYRLGRVLLRGSSGAFSSGFGVGGPTAAMGLGANWRLNDWVAATADYGGVVLSRDMEAVANQLPPLGLTQAWRLGLLFGADGAEHLELYVTNSHTHTLQGMHRGSDQVQVGFEYRLPLWHPAAPVPALSAPAPEVALPDLRGVPDPFTISMASQGPSPSPVVMPLVAAVDAVAEAPAIVPRVLAPARKQSASVTPQARKQGAGVLHVRMGARGYAPSELSVRRGTVVRWVNRDRQSHTATAPGHWDSRWKKPGKAFDYRFVRSGTYPYHCKRHPNERGIVRVI